jgi:hypothetical protein
MVFTYQDKYIKYKKKYLDLKKNISAGSSLQTDIVPGIPLAEDDQYRLNIYEGKRKIESHVVQVNWEDMARYLKSKKPTSFDKLYKTQNKDEQNENILDMPNDEFNNTFVEAVIDLYTNPIILVPAVEKEPDFTIFVKEVLRKMGTLSNINMGTLDKFTDTEFSVSKHAEERDEQRATIRNGLISELQNQKSSNLGTTAVYKDVNGDRMERYFVVTKTAMGVFTANKKGTLITTWALNPTYNDWLATRRKQKSQSVTPPTSVKQPTSVTQPTPKKR